MPYFIGGQREIMKYTFNSTGQIISGAVSFLTVVVVTQIFGSEIKWALAIAVCIGTFFISGFYKRTYFLRIWLFILLSLVLFERRMRG